MRCRIFVSPTERENVLLFFNTNSVWQQCLWCAISAKKRLVMTNRRWCMCSNPSRGESKLYSIESLAREIESIGSLSVEDVEHVMQSFVRSMKKVLVAGNKVKVDGLGIFYTTLTCPRCGTGKGLYGEEYYSCQPSFQGR